MQSLFVIVIYNMLVEKTIFKCLISSILSKHLIQSLNKFNGNMYNHDKLEVNSQIMKFKS